MREGGWAKVKSSHRVGYVLTLAGEKYAHILIDGGQVEIIDTADLTDDLGPRTIHSSFYDSLEYGTVEDGASSVDMFEARKEAMTDVLPLLLERLARDNSVRASLARVGDEDSKNAILEGIAKRALQEYLEETEE